MDCIQTSACSGLELNMAGKAARPHRYPLAKEQGRNFNFKMPHAEGKAAYTHSMPQSIEGSKVNQHATL